jgi:uncharacterized protein YkwD
VGENIGEMPIDSNVMNCGQVSTPQDVANCMMQGWISSPGHYANLIDQNYIEIGVGVACCANTCMLTQDFM